MSKDQTNSTGDKSSRFTSSQVIAFIAFLSFAATTFFSIRSDNRSIKQLQESARNTARLRIEDSIKFYEQLNMLEKQLKTDSINSSQILNSMKEQTALQMESLLAQKSQFQEQSKKQELQFQEQLGLRREQIKNESNSRFLETNFRKEQIRQKDKELSLAINTAYKNEIVALRTLKKDILDNFIKPIKAYKRNASLVTDYSDSIYKQCYLKEFRGVTKKKFDALVNDLIDSELYLYPKIPEISPYLYPGNDKYKSLSSSLEENALELSRLYTRDVEMLNHIKLEKVVNNVLKSLGELLYFTKDFRRQLNETGLSEDQLDSLLKPASFNLFYKRQKNYRDAKRILSQTLREVSIVQSRCDTLLINSKSAYSKIFAPVSQVPDF